MITNNAEGITKENPAASWVFLVTEGVANCYGKFSEEIKLHLAHLRSKFSTKNQRGSDKLIAKERTAESRIETTMGVDCALIVFSGCELSFCNRSIESAFSSANSTNLSVAIADLIFEDALPTSLVDSPRLKRVIELSKLVPLSYRIPDRIAMNSAYLPESYATRARKRDARVMEFATVSCLRQAPKGRN